MAMPKINPYKPCCLECGIKACIIDCGVCPYQTWEANKLIVSKSQRNLKNFQIKIRMKRKDTVLKMKTMLLEEVDVNDYRSVKKFIGGLEKMILGGIDDLTADDLTIDSSDCVSGSDNDSE